MRAEFGPGKFITLWVLAPELSEYRPVLDWVDTAESIYARIDNCCMYSYVFKAYCGDRLLYSPEVDSVPGCGGWRVKCWVRDEESARPIEPTKEQAIALVEMGIRALALRNIEGNWIRWTQALAALLPAPSPTRRGAP